ncbi:aldose 1-epimerase [Pedobacter steynii]|uniref:Aldose 1-epimerase n=1 Tax=Pedobacter steynii TaxID=430522 RepID=A0A1H0C463_9SPHI|nr:aldose epimerase family protein [Pedobacter steynii]NQX41463.1 galactose mutarotase [Pedobacter steynii]SDN52649.1 aldose 1-epimerase [Pedobacter steynii]
METKLIKTGKFIDGKEILGIELTNTHGTYVKIFNYGAIINKFIVQNKRGEKQDIVLGFDDFEGYVSEAYLADYPYLGAVIGRYANRVKNGRFTIDGTVHQLTQAKGGDCLHGGNKGFDKQVWDVLSTIDPSVTLQYVSPDGEEHFPGNLTLQLTFKLTDDNELILDFKGSTDQATAINITHHSYFNLSPDLESVGNHHHRMPASHYLEQDDNYAVTGKLIPVEGTIHDFLGGKLISQDWDPEEGYDQSYVLDKEYGEFTLASETSEEKSGLKLSVYTTEPVVHLYTAKYTSVKHGKGGVEYHPYGAFCVETQHHPNGINIPSFPSTILRPGETYKQTTIYKIEHN